MMYLDRRGNGYRFQIAVPSDLQERVGKSPIRIQLGNLTAFTARQAARLLSGHAEKLFIAARSSKGGTMDADPRDSIIAELIWYRPIAEEFHLLFGWRSIWAGRVAQNREVHVADSQANRQGERLRSAAASLGRGAHIRLAWPMQATGQGLGKINRFR